MDYLKSWSYCICVSLIIAVIFSLFSPKGKMNRFYKILISVFVFLSFLYPIKDFNAKSISFYDFNFNEELFEQNQAKPYENMVENQIKSVLINNSVTGAGVSSKICYDENSELIVESVEIAIPAEYDKKEIEKLISNELGINARVIYLGE